MGLWANYFSAGQLYVAFIRIREREDVLLLHKIEDRPSVSIFHPMPDAVLYPVLRE